jgi:hypothetical protein
MCTQAHGTIIKELYIGGVKRYLKAADPLENDKIVFFFLFLSPLSNDGAINHYHIMRFK